MITKNGKKLMRSDRFWTRRSTKCARDCSESSVSQKIVKNRWVPGTFGTSFLSIGSFQFSDSCLFHHVNSFSSIPPFHNSFVSIHSFHSFKFIVSFHSCQFRQFNSFIPIHSFQFLRLNSFMSSRSCQLIHATSFSS